MTDTTQVTDERALKSCPFGRDHRVVVADDGVLPIHVRCRDCGVQLFGHKRHFSSVDEAIATWNRRAPADAEPVGIVYTMEALVPGGVVKHHAELYKPLPAGTKLYTAPPEREPLSDVRIAEIASTPCAVPGSYVHAFARAIEAAHGIGAKEAPHAQ